MESQKEVLFRRVFSFNYGIRNSARTNPIYIRLTVLPEKQS